MDNAFPIIDTHAHLHMDQFDADRATVIERAVAAGVTRMVEIGYDLPSSHAAIALAEAYPQVFAVVGVQANHLDNLPTDWLAQVRALAAHPRVVAIGEIGLDFYWKKAPLEEQEEVLRLQLSLARELGLPVVIHSRDAQADTLRILADTARGQPGILHSFLGDWAFAEGCLDVGFMLSFSGPLTFAKLHDLHDVARRVPATMMLAETDSPYLTPHPHRGRRNEPAHVAYVVRQLAALRNEPLEQVAAQLWANAERVFAKLG
ncbi:MAG: TatD family deoxyribonuclease [Candidatus Viridilinea halotolerans]|uniref:TatD family deoxyribonuclease n=1 Tax=Candidatus Viridilinea halotolerans TaxID=2491704 RepID=A0A426U9M3_9CHLR|nr:MAG: TatD family deoxyribonuclease [Candidatus Viridilinea halotolerans]